MLATSMSCLAAAGAGPALQYQGRAVTPGEFGAVAPVGAVQTVTGYEVAWKVTGADEYVVWNTGSNGNYTSTVLGG